MQHTRMGRRSCTLRPPTRTRLPQMIDVPAPGNQRISILLMHTLSNTYDMPDNSEHQPQYALSKQLSQQLPASHPKISRTRIHLHRTLLSRIHSVSKYSSTYIDKPSPSKTRHQVRYVTSSRRKASEQRPTLACNGARGYRN